MSKLDTKNEMCATHTNTSNIQILIFYMKPEMFKWDSKETASATYKQIIYHCII